VIIKRKRERKRLFGIMINGGSTGERAASLTQTHTVNVDENGVSPLSSLLGTSFPWLPILTVTDSDYLSPSLMPRWKERENPPDALSLSRLSYHFPPS
jgi:hypothetical protein